MRFGRLQDENVTESSDFQFFRRKEEWKPFSVERPWDPNPNTGNGTRISSGERVRSRDGNHYGKGPRNFFRSDQRIKEDVGEALTWDPRIDASEMEVDVTRGVVKLQGSVDSRKTRRLIEEVVEKVSGVKDIVNELKI